MFNRRSVLGACVGVAAAALPGASALSARRRHKLPRPGVQAISAPVPAAPAQTPIGPLDTQARWAFILDATTGTVLLQKAADDPMPPSSLTKMMTAYLVFAALKRGRLRLDQTLPVSEKAWRMQGSKMFVPLGQQVSVEDLIRGMLIQSGNDACIVLAEGLSGSEDQFAVLMNREAQRLRLTQSHFENATGWPVPDHHMSVRDVATLALHLIQDFPQYYHFFSERSYDFNGIDQGNRNVLVDKGLADGLKTGHTDAGGFGLCASAEREGRRVIEVLNGLPSSRARAEEGERLLGWAFANFEDVHLFAKGHAIQAIPVWLGVDQTVLTTVSQDVVLTLPNGWRSRTKISIDFRAPIAAPVRAGQPVGQVVISGGGLDDLRVPLVAAASVPRLALPGRAVAVLGHALGGG